MRRRERGRPHGFLPGEVRVREPYEVTLARCYLAGGDSQPIKSTTAPEIARALIAMHEDSTKEIERLRQSIRLHQKILSDAVDGVHELQVELVDTRRERNRNRQYVGDCAEIVRCIFQISGKGNYDSTIRECDKMEDQVLAMAEEVGR